MDKVHPKYAGLKDSVRDSEVLASQYASETMKIADTVDTEEFEQTMKDWDKLFLKEGLTVNNANIGVFSEITLTCEETGQKDLAGRFALSIVSALHQVARQYMTSADLLDRLEGVSDRLYFGVDKMEKQTEALSKIIPKKKVLIAKKRRESVTAPVPVPHHDSDPSAQAVKSGPYVVLTDKGRNTSIIDITHGSGSGDQADMETEDHNIEEETTENRQDTNIDTALTNAEELKDKCRRYYGDPRFDDLPLERQVAIIEYYMIQILGVKEETWMKDQAKYQMLADLMDKGRVLQVCEVAKSGEVPPSLLRDSVEEIAHAINVCHSAYGDYGAIALTEGHVTRLHIS